MLQTELQPGAVGEGRDGAAEGAGHDQPVRPGNPQILQGVPLYWPHQNLAKSNMIHDTSNFSKCQKISGT